MQFQADVLGVPVKRNEQTEATAWGVAKLAGIAANLIQENKFSGCEKSGSSFLPNSDRKVDYDTWRKAVGATIYFAT